MVGLLDLLQIGTQQGQPVDEMGMGAQVAPAQETAGYPGLEALLNLIVPQAGVMAAMGALPAGAAIRGGDLAVRGIARALPRLRQAFREATPKGRARLKRMRELEHQLREIQQQRQYFQGRMNRATEDIAKRVGEPQSALPGMARFTGPARLRPRSRSVRRTPEYF